jgi:hypothetical protein
MKKQILEEIKDMRYLLNYNRGKVISEQINEEEDFINIDDFELYDPEGDDLDSETDWSQLEEDMDFEDMDNGEELYGSFDSDGNFVGMKKTMGDMELDEEMDLPVMLPGTKEKERTITTPGIKPGTKPETPYSPKPGPKKNPKARKGDMPEWLSFDELGIDFE